MAVQAELKITLTTEGQIQVSGELENKLLAYGLLEVARDAIKEFHDQKAKSAIIPASASDIPDRSKDRHLAFDAPLRNV